MCISGLIGKANIGDVSIWIGLQNEVNGGLHWADYSPVTFFNFGDGEPNGADGDEHCGGRSR